MVQPSGITTVATTLPSTQPIMSDDVQFTTNFSTPPGFPSNIYFRPSGTSLQPDAIPFLPQQHQQTQLPTPQPQSRLPTSQCVTTSTSTSKTDKTKNNKLLDQDVKNHPLYKNQLSQLEVCRGTNISQTKSLDLKNPSVSWKVKISTCRMKTNDWKE